MTNVCFNGRECLYGGWKAQTCSLTHSSLCQVVFEGIRGNGFEGDIAIDDVSVTKGKCKQKDSVDKTGLYHQQHF